MPEGWLCRPESLRHFLITAVCAVGALCMFATTIASRRRLSLGVVSPVTGKVLHCFAGVCASSG